MAKPNGTHGDIELVLVAHYGSTTLSTPVYVTATDARALLLDLVDATPTMLDRLPADDFAQRRYEVLQRHHASSTRAVSKRRAATTASPYCTPPGCGEKGAVKSGCSLHNVNHRQPLGPRLELLDDPQALGSVILHVDHRVERNAVPIL